MLLLLAFVYVAWCVALSFKQTDLLFPRSFANTLPQLPAPPAGTDSWWRQDGETKIEAWFMLGDGRSADSPGPAVILLHGNGETIDNWVGIAHEYTERGISVLLPEYRGYGRSTGTPSERAILGDVLAFHTRLIEQSSVRSEQVFYHGRSLGGGVAMQLAKERQPAALILDCTFTSVASFASQYYVPAFIVRDPFRSDAVIAGLACPILISHGKDDDIIPYSHADKLASLAKQATLLQLPGGHLDFPADADLYNAERWKFLKRVGLITN